MAASSSGPANGRVVVVTGSTRGIGRGLAQELLKRGARVVVSGRSQESVDKALAALGAGDRAVGVPADVSKGDDHQRLWDRAVEAFGRVDIWVNNAGISLVRKPVWEQSPADLQAIVDTNLVGVMHGTSVAVRGMLAQGGRGMVWNMEGFGSGGQKSDGLAPYGSTKRAVTYFTDCVTKDLEGMPVGVAHLSPGIVVTDLLVDDYEGQPEKFEKAKKFFNILGDQVETVTPYLADGILAEHKSGDRVAWLTTPKASGRFFKRFVLQQKRDLFADVAAPAAGGDTAAGKHRAS
jgi:NAD(P)-dependent dehydrogenase (short-subunit alcohol dehydrogenase family)